MTCNIEGALIRLRYFMQRDGAALNSGLRTLLRVIEQWLHLHCAGAAELDKASVHIAALALIQRLGVIQLTLFLGRPCKRQAW